MAARFPTVVSEINALVASIAKKIAGLPPHRLLHMAWWEFAAAILKLGTGKTSDMDQTSAMRMIDYVQSVVASVKPGEYADEVSEATWNELKSDVGGLFTRLTLEYQMCLTAHLRAQNQNLDMELEEFRFRAETLWMNVRGKRYQCHEKQALLDILAPHSDVLVELFGIDARSIVNELDKILWKLTHGLSDAMIEFIELRENTLERFERFSEADSEASFEELRDRVLEDPDVAEKHNKVFGQVFGLDLFDVSKNTNLPAPLLKELMWLPGEEVEFFAPGDFSGWPLRIWPTMKRPFIRLDQQIYSFDVFTLFDNFYRVIQRAIFRLKPSYKESWNSRQQAVSEELPFRYLGGLLPGAQIYRPVYYEWRMGAGRAQWHEADGLIIFDDHLFVIEVKAGAFTYTSPATDLPAHLASLRNLMESPASQGSRFIDFRESAKEVSICDAQHNEIARLRRTDFRHITVCAVTLDAFTHLAARAQQLKHVGINVGARPIWVVSIDDLRVCADIFNNPLNFLHFVEQRMLAAQSEFVDVDDEIDHIGLYLTENNYTQYAAEILNDRTSKMNFTGYSTPVDEYFSSVVRGEPMPQPRQLMPARLIEIIDFLAHSTRPRRVELASFLLDAGGEFRNSFAATIETALRENKMLGRARPLSVYGGMASTLYVWSPSAPRLEADAIDHTRAVLLANGETSRLLIELVYTDDGTLNDVSWNRVSLAGLSEQEIDRIRTGSVALTRRRMENAAAKGKIGVNQPCPCGSGKKYKRCHGRRA
jgi:preprotein translocase subunit SecA